MYSGARACGCVGVRCRDSDTACAPRASVTVAGGAAVVAGLGGASEVALVLGEEDGAAPRRARRSARSPHGSQSYDISIINLIG